MYHMKCISNQNGAKNQFSRRKPFNWWGHYELKDKCSTVSRKQQICKFSFNEISKQESQRTYEHVPVCCKVDFSSFHLDNLCPHH